MYQIAWTIRELLSVHIQIVPISYTYVIAKNSFDDVFISSLQRPVLLPTQQSYGPKMSHSHKKNPCETAALAENIIKDLRPRLAEPCQDKR